MVEISLQFNSIDEAIVALAKLTAGKKARIVADTEVAPAVLAPLEVINGKARKGRSDKGKPRSTYNHGLPLENAAPDAPVAADSKADAAGSTPSPTGGEPAGSEGAGAILAPTAPASVSAGAAASAPTLEDAQKKLEALFNAKGLPAALKVLQTFGKKRVQDVPAEARVTFMKLVDEALV